ncbi:MAG: lipopolysaccharide transport periplasmic protein LptA [Burkholderiales bacterium]|nr:lipopolysaccharide transport periplasmic protein LptA [Burkholderiales bacterium]
MKRIFSITLFVLNMIGNSCAYAEKADADKPTQVEADKMVYDDVKQINTFTGNVFLTRGTLTMKASQVVVTQDASGYQFATLHGGAGSLASFRQKRDGGPNLWVEGQAEKLEYDGKNDVVKLYAKAKLRRLDGNKPTDEVEGEFITYDSRNEFFSVNNAPASAGKSSSGRVKVIIQPRTEAKQ